MSSPYSIWRRKIITFTFTGLVRWTALSRWRSGKWGRVVKGHMFPGGRLGRGGIHGDGGAVAEVARSSLLFAAFCHIIRFNIKLNGMTQNLARVLRFLNTKSSLKEIDMDRYRFDFIRILNPTWKHKIFRLHLLYRLYLLALIYHFLLLLSNNVKARISVGFIKYKINFTYHVKWADLR